MTPKKPTPAEVAAQSARLRSGGWALLHPAGWASHEVEVQVERIAGEARVVGLRLTPKGERERGITLNRLRTLPVQSMAEAAAALLQPTDPEVWTALQRLGGRGERPATRVEQVAEVWLQARDRSEAPRAAVCREFYMPRRTADNYIAKARAQGLIPPARPRGAAKGKRPAPDNSKINRGREA